MSREPKTCKSCGRRFEWRRKWQDNWAEVVWCSAACRTRKVTATDRACEQTILALLAQRRPGATICPSEAARRQFGENWRAEMETVRRAARRLVHAGVAEITQRGQAVDPSEFKGPIRIRLDPSAP